MFFGPTFFIFRFHKKNGTLTWNFCFILFPLMNFIFWFFVLMPRILQADLLQEGMTRIAHFFASFTGLYNFNQDPAQKIEKLGQLNRLIRV